jgi:uroporphyrinogen-III synthase
MTETFQPLLGRQIWLTRPQDQSLLLQDVLRQAGAQVFSFPLLHIENLEPHGLTLSRLKNLDQYDLVFYVSSNAARAGMAAINNWWPQYPSHILNFAVGPATAAVVESHGLVVHYPQDRMDSEAMLALPQLHDIAGMKALIVRGVGGREILAEGLLARGAKVDYAELYERKAPQYTRTYMKNCLQQHQPDAIVISSGEAMDNLKALFSPWYAQWIRLPLYVASQRLADHAQLAGFDTVVVMGGATDAAIIKGLLSAFKNEGKGASEAANEKANEKPNEALKGM